MEIRLPFQVLAAFFLMTGLSFSNEEKKTGTAPPSAPPATSSLSITARLGAKEVILVGPDSRQQMVITATSSNKKTPLLDVTTKATFTSTPAGIVEVDSHGFITPLADGKTTITVSHKSDKSASIQVTVNRFKTPPPISFPNDIVPVFTRNGCNAGACHAKSAGQNGFRLSLFGYSPEMDHEYIVNESRGRRIFPASPKHSLLLTKLTGETPHGGGARIDEESLAYKKMLRWIEEGTIYTPDNDPVVERIEIFPRERIVQPHSKQQLLVTAYFSDGSTRDITHSAQFESNQEDMAEVDETGLISFESLTGTTSVMVRFQEQIDVFMAIIPLGIKMPPLPKPNNFIDEQIFHQLTILGLPPSGNSDDNTFLRRVSLDIAGRLPSIEESKTFLASKDPKKRAVKIDELLDSTGYADFFAGKWVGLLRNKSGGGLDWVSRNTYAFHSWLRSSLLKNKPYDQIAGELITASGKTSENPAVSWYRVVKDPKEQMQDIAQVFLGIRMQCAQCHHHPYEKWSMDDYYGLTAFFTTIGRKEIYKLPEEDIIYHNRKAAQAQNPNSKKIIKPTPLGGKELDIPAEEDPRRQLADWVRSKNNPYFARMLVNRYWKHFFSRGLVEPEDDIRPTNPATHPKLMKQLTQHFIDSGFDLKDLIRTICNSRTYQLSAEPNEHNGDDEQNFARYYPKRLQAEVLLDSINEVAGTENSFNKQPMGVRAIALPDDNANKESEFLTMFGRPQMDTASESERTGDANLGQSLHLINSDKIQAIIGNSKGRAHTLAKEKDRSDDDRITEIYIQAVSRPPNQNELGFAKNHLKKKRALSAADPKKLPAAKAEQEAFEDILWVLVNTKEFLFNH
ncbi:MAG: DUF1549 and DUF1553 domain-containing protein [Verrucomicrobiota bacterium]